MDLLKHIITEISPFLRQFGYQKKGNSFYLLINKNYGIINFQKSKDNNSEITRFTINFGVYSNVLSQELDYEYTKITIPNFEQCHWQARIGFFMLGCPDFWWSVKESDNLNEITNKVMEEIENIVFFQLNKRFSDEGLINCWLHETFSGTTAIGKFKYLTILLKEKQDFKTLHEFVSKFIVQSNGKPDESRAFEHLKEIKYDSTI